MFNNRILNGINWGHKLNKGRLLWYCATPLSGWTGGKRFRDLVKNASAEDYQAFLQGSSVWRRTKLHAGGYDSIFLDGTSGTYLKCLQPTAALCQLNNNFTLAAWIRQDALSTYTAQLAGIMGTYQEPFDDNWYFRISGSKLEFGGNTSILSGNVITLGEWYRVIAVIKGGVATIYQNCVPVATGSISIPGTVGRPVVIGSDFESPNHGDARYITGALNDLSVFNRPFSVADVLLDYEESRKGYPNAWNWIQPVTYSTTAISASIDESVNNTLTLNQNATVFFSLNETASNTFALSQTARVFNGTKIINQSLALNSVLSLSSIYKRTITHTLPFTQAASVSQIRTANNAFTISQSVTSNSYKGANSALVLTQTLTVTLNPHFERLSHFVTFSHVVTPTRIMNRAFTSTFIPTSIVTAIKVKNISVGNIFIPRDVSATSKILQPNNVLVITDSVVQSHIINRTIFNALGLTQTFVKQAILNLRPSNSLVFRDTHYRITEVAGHQELVPIPSVLVTKPNYMVVLQVPGAALTLRRPELGDTEAGLSKIVQKRTTTGGLHTYVRRVSSRKLKYTFEIPRAKFVETKMYMRDNLSLPMYLTNWKGEIWFGCIVNNPFSVELRKRSLLCDNEIYSIELEFEGVKIHG